MFESAELRVLHWNVHFWLDEAGASNLDTVAELIHRLDVDAVSLVEVDEPTAGPSPLDALAAMISYHSVFVPAFEYGEGRPTGSFGNAILSRLPIMDVRQAALLWPPRTYDGTEPSEPRALLLIRVEAKAGAVWIGSTHLPRADAMARASALDRVLSIMSGLSAPWLLLGDFNMAAREWSDSYPQLRVAPADMQPSYPSSGPTECIDYCVSPDDQRVHAEILDSSGSDHLPVLVRLIG